MSIKVKVLAVKNIEAGFISRAYLAFFVYGQYLFIKGIMIREERFNLRIPSYTILLLLCSSDGC